VSIIKSALYSYLIIRVLVSVADEYVVKLLVVTSGLPIFSFNKNPPTGFLINLKFPFKEDKVDNAINI
jgi:hypothetical protein